MAGSVPKYARAGVAADRSRRILHVGRGVQRSASRVGGRGFDFVSSERRVCKQCGATPRRTLVRTYVDNDGACAAAHQQGR